MDPKAFETVYIRRDYIEKEIDKMLKAVSALDYGSLNEYDKGGFDGYKQGITELLKKIQSKFGDKF